MNVSKILKQDFASTQTGTPYYASPEVWRDEDYNAKADIWSLGCVLFELCNLKQPFQASGLDRLYKKVQAKHIEAFEGVYSKGLQNLIQDCLTLDYHKRPSAKMLIEQPMFDQLRESKKEKDMEKSLLKEGNVQTKVKYKRRFYQGKLEKAFSGVDKESETLEVSNRRETKLSREDKIIEYLKRGTREKVRRWGRLVSENDSFGDESIMGTIPVDLNFKDLAEKLPKSRYSLSGEKPRRDQNLFFNQPRRSKSGIRIAVRDNRERLKMLKERRLKLMEEEAFHKANRKNLKSIQSRKLKRKSEVGNIGSVSVLTRKSKEAMSIHSGISRRTEKQISKRRKSRISEKRKLKNKPGIPKSKENIQIKKLLGKESNVIGRSLLKEKQEQDRILSKIEICNSQLVKQGNLKNRRKEKSIVSLDSKNLDKKRSNNSSISRSPNTLLKSREVQTTPTAKNKNNIISKQRINENIGQLSLQTKGLAKHLFDKKKILDCSDAEIGKNKERPSSQNYKHSTEISNLMKLELNNSYNLLRPIEHVKLSHKEILLKEKKVEREKSPPVSLRTDTSLGKLPKRIIVDKITYTFSKKEKLAESQNNGQNSVHHRKSRRPKKLEHRKKCSPPDEYLFSKGLPKVKSKGISVPEIKLEEGNVVLRHRTPKQLGSEFLNLMQKNIGQYSSNNSKIHNTLLSKKRRNKQKCDRDLVHCRRKSDVPGQRLDLGSLKRRTGYSEYLIDEVVFLFLQIYSQDIHLFSLVDQ